jgi:hypothetical protein
MIMSIMHHPIHHTMKNALPSITTMWLVATILPPRRNLIFPAF